MHVHTYHTTSARRAAATDCDDHAGTPQFDAFRDGLDRDGTSVGEDRARSPFGVMVILPRRVRRRCGLVASISCLLAAAVVGSISHFVLEKSWSSSRSLSYSASLKLVHNNHQRRPPLSSLISDDRKNITAQVDWILDFIVAGHPKCGTTSLMHALYQHPQVLMYNHEVHSLQNGKAAELVELLHSLPESNGTRGRDYYSYKRSYKAPNEIRRSLTLWLIRQYFPRTKLVVGLRHPVWWFQSWWNFKTAQGFLNRSAEAFVGTAFPPMLQYHRNLAQLGKTNFTADERALLEPNFPRGLDPSDLRLCRELGIPTRNNRGTAAEGSARTEYLPVESMTNQVFLYVDSQLNDPETSLSVLADLQAFLELDQPIAPIQHDNTAQEHPLARRLDICHDQNRIMRQALVKLGENMAEWILRYFLPHPDVTVSNRDHFVALLQIWGKDPCPESMQSDTNPY